METSVCGEYHSLLLMFYCFLFINDDIQQKIVKLPNSARVAVFYLQYYKNITNCT